MSILNSAKAMAGSAFGKASWAGAALGSRAMGMSTTGRIGAMAGAGALYGGTVGRDPGQSRLGGAMAGALGGVGLYGAGRYGRAGYKGFVRSRAAGSTMGDSLGRAGKSMFARASADGMRAYRYIGNTATRANAGFNKFTSLHK